MIIPVNIADTMCSISYCVDWGYNQAFNCDLRRTHCLVIYAESMFKLFCEDAFKFIHDLTHHKSRHHVLNNLLFIKLVYTWLCNSDLSGHILLAIYQYAFMHFKYLTSE